MKVAKPEWLVESVEKGVLLPWQDFIFRPGYRIEPSQGMKLLETSHFGASVPSSRSTAASAAAQLDLRGTIDISVDESVEGSAQSKLPHFPEPPSPHNIPHRMYNTNLAPPQASRVPSYAAHTSNPNAERAMANPEWRSAHTSVAADFIEGYYKNSRLHHLSTWKAELKNLVAEAQERAESSLGTASHGQTLAVDEHVWNTGGIPSIPDNVSMKGAELIMKSPSKGKAKARADADERVIMHCDFDCFFVSAGLVSRPHLRGKAVVVCHSQGNQGGNASTSEIASSSYEARKFGIKNGMRYAFFFSFFGGP